MVPRHGSAALSAVLMLAAFATAGCDKPRGPSATVPGATQPAAPAVAAESTAGAVTAAASQPATRPTDTRPASSFLTVDGRVTEFPSARLRLTRTDEGVRALLFSNDPKEAISADYQGNSFYFDLPLKIDDVGDIAEAEYSYKAMASESEGESPDGIFLNGMRTQLQPQDVAIRFDGESPKVVVRLAGRFLVVNASGVATSGQFAAVAGNLYVTVESKAD